MSEQSFTLGPWSLDDQAWGYLTLNGDSTRWPFYTVRAAGGEIAYVISEPTIVKPDPLANARLMAAAPDLHGVCAGAPIISKYHGQRGFELERFIADYDAWTQTRLAALSKANGAPSDQAERDAGDAG